MTMLKEFVVIRKLSVGNIRIEPKRVMAQYNVEHLDGHTESYELIYSYDKSYFDPKRAADVNLVCMMLAQVALNYGLFCETMEFDGLYDKVDRRFLADMLENTSREILTNKLLIDNQFILPQYKPLSIEKRDRYTQAELVFVNTGFSNLSLQKEEEQSDDTAYAILSSGGKDSLLTYGIIKEIGTPHPVFINESGRHWFTAVNSYRHLKETEPNTEKPWCNSDRVFNWMLKQLPFIRKDYASIRADIYPIRLWTVSVFLFGVLPVVRKRGIGNILVGNEYDTTLRGKTAGLDHYSGLYDQSKFFDNALTRYYQRKGWKIRQYSILRSMSELLIMNMLSSRYPDLQRHQVSCHAAHKVDDRMKPCGNCEKCRRIIGMLSALGADPGICGYSPEQIMAGLSALGKKSIKQIGSDASHLYYLLLEKNLIDRNEHTKKLAKKHNEITKLRFDRERSSLADLPEYVRNPLFSLLMQYGDGAVQRKDRRWQPVEMDDDFLFALPYTLEQK